MEDYRRQARMRVTGARGIVDQALVDGGDEELDSRRYRLREGHGSADQPGVLHADWWNAATTCGTGATGLNITGSVLDLTVPHPEVTAWGVAGSLLHVPSGLPWSTQTRHRQHICQAAQRGRGARPGSAGSVAGNAA